MTKKIIFILTTIMNNIKAESIFNRFVVVTEIHVKAQLSV
jgi:hypothetical protein